MKKWVALSVFVVFLGGGTLGLGLLARTVANRLNGVNRKTPYQATEAGRSLHQRLFIADLHADPLLWNRDLLKRSTSGHVDVPRLLAGNVAIQVFGVVTKTPSGMNVERNDSNSDQIRLLAVAQRWPPHTWTSLLGRARYQAQKLHGLASASNGRLTVIRSRADWDAFAAARSKDPARVGSLLGLEGLHAIEGQASHVDVLFQEGFRMAGLAHFFDNELSGSAHGVTKGGLSPLGREVIAKMESLGMTLDLAHASEKTIDDVLALATKPVVVSHTGVRGTCESRRNLSDDHLRAIAKNGGVIGVGYWRTATCGDDAKSIARAMAYAVRVAGLDHVGLGSDFDGAVSMPFDTAGLVELTDALLAQGFDAAAVTKLMGENVSRVLYSNLPAHSVHAR
jgi:membrane dipeptidase